ncbi:MAG: hypothetical protein M3Z01_03540 [Thermoproteota archaeon]|nr:hypothetical protein [Thermoproteota archaeon]
MADSIGLHTTIKNEDYFTLVRQLTTSLNKEADKVRAIFRWITNNIAYDYKAFNKGKTDPFFVCLNNNNCNAQQEIYNTELIHRILKRKKAVCNGYSLLFKALCSIAGIKSDIVTGYAKTEFYQIGNKWDADHAWNIVQIDSNWYCLDITWASGMGIINNETDEMDGWKKQFIPFFYCTPYEKFVRNHFPEHPEQLKFIDSKTTTDDFFKFPFFYSLAALKDIDSLNPTTGILNVKVGDTIAFSFKNSLFEHFQINSNIQRNPSVFKEIGKGKKRIYAIDREMLAKQVYYPYKKKGDTIFAIYPVTSKSLYYIELLFDYEQAVRYKVNVSP